MLITTNDPEIPHLFVVEGYDYSAGTKAYVVDGITNLHPGRVLLVVLRLDPVDMKLKGNITTEYAKSIGIGDPERIKALIVNELTTWFGLQIEIEIDGGTPGSA